MEHLETYLCSLNGEKQVKCHCRNSQIASRNTRTVFSRSGPNWYLTVCVVFVSLLVISPGVYCQDESGKNGTQQTQRESGTTSGDKDVRAIDKAMEPLYIMTNGFLNLIQPKEAGFILDEANLLDDISDGNFEVILMSFEDWEMWVTHYLGFVICVIFGLLFIIVMPITGFCFCCCRLCGNCGAKGDMDEKKSDRCKRGTCGFLLAIFCLIVLAGMVCGFVTNELLREQTMQNENRAVLNTINTELQSLDNFKSSTIMSFRSSVITAIDDTADEVIGDIQSAANTAKDKLGEVTDSVDMLDEALELAATTETINETLTIINDSTRLLVNNRNSLIKQLTDVRTDIDTSLQGCSGTLVCDNLRNEVNNLQATGDYTQVDDVADELQSVQNVLGNNLADLIRQGQTEYEKIESLVQGDIQKELDKAEDEVEKIKDEVNKNIDGVIKDLEQFQFNGTRAQIKSLQPDVEKFGTFRYYAGIGLCCLLLLIVMFALLGLCFGCCGESAGDEAGTCNRSVGATILMVGVAFSFLFAWIIMIIIMVIFLGGGLTYTEVCRYAVDIPNAPEPVKNTIDTFVSNQLKGTELNIQLTQVFEDCKNNKALFQSLNLSQIVNLTEVMDLNNYGISGTIDDIINSVNVDLSGVVIFSNETRHQLGNLINAGLSNINFTSYIIQLDRGLVSLNLTQLASDLDTAAADLEAPNPATATQLRNQANTLRNIETSTVADMLSYTNKLKAAIPTLMSAVDGPPSLNDKLQSLISSLVDAQNNIQKNGTLFIQQFIRETGDAILYKLNKHIQGLACTIENEIGRCEPIYKSVDNIVHAGCVNVLDPFNGFWFCIGMSLFFLIPIIIVSVCLIGLYRKTDEYYDDKSFDDVNYDAYTGVYPGDNIPLEDSRPRMY